MKKALIILVSGCFFLVSCGNDSKKPTITKQEVSFKKEGELTLYKSTGEAVKVLDIEIADNDYETQTGLMYRSSMQDDRGMLFVFPKEELRYFYMKNTEIALDIIYIGADKRIVSFSENAQPLNESSLPSEVPAQYVLEVNAGLAEKWLLEVGDYVEWTKTE